MERKAAVHRMRLTFFCQRPPSVGHVGVYKNQRRPGTAETVREGQTQCQDQSSSSFAAVLVRAKCRWGNAVLRPYHYQRLLAFQLEEYVVCRRFLSRVADQKHFVWRLGQPHAIGCDQLRRIRVYSHLRVLSCHMRVAIGTAYRRTCDAFLYTNRPLGNSARKNRFKSVSCRNYSFICETFRCRPD
jgi:hypothetical protein